MEPRKLVALDRDDLEVVSTHLQAAVLNVADVRWQPDEKRLVLALNRYDWCCTEDGDPDLRPCRAVLRFERVKAFQSRNCRACDRDEVLNLLAVEFAEQDGPGGTIILTFSGGKAMRLAVECLDAELADLGPDLGPVLGARGWPTHPDDVTTV